MLVTVATDQQWLVYVAPLPGQNGIHDDFLVGDDQAMAKLVSEWNVEWLPDREDDRLENEAFDLRRHWPR